MAPSIDVEDDVDPHDEDYAYHVRTFNRFLSTARYFAIHVGILLVALYFFAIGNQPVLGAILILCSIGLLGFGFLKQAPTRLDVTNPIRSCIPNDRRGARPEAGE